MGAKIWRKTCRTWQNRQYAKEGAATGALLAGAETPAKAYVESEQTVGDHFKRLALETAAGPQLPGLQWFDEWRCNICVRRKGTISYFLTYRMMSALEDNKGRC